MPLERAIGEVVNIGNTEEVTIGNLAKIVKQTAGKCLPIHVHPLRQGLRAGF